MPFRAALFGKVTQEPLELLRTLSEATALCLRAAVFSKTRRMNRDGLFSPLVSASSDFRLDGFPRAKAITNYPLIQERGTHAIGSYLK